MSDNLLWLLSFGLMVVLLDDVTSAHVHHRNPAEGQERIEDGWNDIHYKDGQHNSEFDHEAVLGSKDEANQFNGLSPEESRERLKLLVTKRGMDANSDGFVNRNELIDWVLKSFKSLAEEDGKERLEEEDGNHDGIVTWEEHLHENFDIDAEMAAKTKDEMFLEDRALWLAADENGDGSLDTKEFAAFNSPEEFESMQTVLYDQTMLRRDKNKDGFLSLDEYLADHNGNVMDSKSEGYTVEKDRFSQDYDLDKNGYLNKLEVLSWIIPNNREMAEAEADHLISNSDSDSDGKLSIEEIVANYEGFVGSEATDFGEKLSSLKDEL